LANFWVDFPWESEQESPCHYFLGQWFPTGEEFLPREEFHEFWGGISTL